MIEQQAGQSNDLQSKGLHYLSPQEIMGVWQHFAKIGGHDKDRMVTILMFLSPILLGTIGFAYTTKDPDQQQVAATVGFFSSLIAAAVVLMYAGYANRNWEVADEIAENYLSNVALERVNTQKYLALAQGHVPLSDVLKPKPEDLSDFGLFGRFIQAIARWLSQPHHPKKSLAPIFMLFFVLSLISALTSLLILIGKI